MQNIIQSSIEKYDNLLSVEYDITIGRKGKKRTLHIVFRDIDYHHLAGLHYLTDRPELNGPRDLSYHKIVSGQISSAEIIRSKDFLYISDRVYLAGNILELLKGEIQVFKYDERKNPYSKIQADYVVLTYDENGRIYIFLAYDQDNNTYSCRSIFYGTNIHYERNQIKYSILNRSTNS